MSGKRLPRRLMSMADRIDDGVVNHSITQGKRKPSAERESSAERFRRRYGDDPPWAKKAEDTAREIERELEHEVADQELTDAIAFQDALDQARASKERLTAIRHAVKGGIDNAGLAVAAVIALAGFVVLLVTIAAMYAPARYDPSTAAPAGPPVVVNVGAPTTATIGGTLVPPLDCEGDEVITFTGPDILACVPADNLAR